MLEFIPVVHAESGERTGLVLPRHEALRQQVWRQTTSIFILNQHGDLLCHQRSLEKETFAGNWTTHLGGHVGAHETFESNAIKELEEEANIRLQAEQLLTWRTTRIDKFCIWVREFVSVIHDQEYELIPQPGEVEAFKWMSIQEVLDKSKKNPNEWLAGTHDIFVEYHCLKAVSTLAQSLGIIKPSHPTWHAWQPVTKL